MSMQFIDLKKQYEVLKKGIDAGIAKVLSHGHYIGGGEVKQLSEELAAYTNRFTFASCAANSIFTKPEIFTSVVVIGSLIDRGTDPSAA